MPVRTFSAGSLFAIAYVTPALTRSGLTADPITQAAAAARSNIDYCRKLIVRASRSAYILLRAFSAVQKCTSGLYPYRRVALKKSGMALLTGDFILDFYAHSKTPVPKYISIVLENYMGSKADLFVERMRALVGSTAFIEREVLNGAPLNRTPFYTAVRASFDRRRTLTSFYVTPQGYYQWGVAAASIAAGFTVASNAWLGSRELSSSSPPMVTSPLVWNNDHLQLAAAFDARSSIFAPLGAQTCDWPGLPPLMALIFRLLQGKPISVPEHDALVASKVPLPPMASYTVGRSTYHQAAGTFCWQFLGRFVADISIQFGPPKVAAWPSLVIDTTISRDKEYTFGSIPVSIGFFDPDLSHPGSFAPCSVFVDQGELDSCYAALRCADIIASGTNVSVIDERFRVVAPPTCELIHSDLAVSDGVQATVASTTTVLDRLRAMT